LLTIVLVYFMQVSGLLSCVGAPGWDGIVPGKSTVRNVVALYGDGYSPDRDVLAYMDEDLGVTLVFEFAGESQWVQAFYVSRGIAPRQVIPAESRQSAGISVDAAMRILPDIGLGTGRSVVAEMLGQPDYVASDDEWRYALGADCDLGTLTLEFKDEEVAGIQVQMALD